MSRPAGARGRGPLPRTGEPLPLSGGLSSRELPGHRRPLHTAHPAGDGAPEVSRRPTPLQRVQVYGQAHQQCVWQEEEVSVMVPERDRRLCIWTHIKRNWPRGHMLCYGCVDTVSNMDDYVKG